MLELPLRIHIIYIVLMLEIQNETEMHLAIHWVTGSCASNFKRNVVEEGCATAHEPFLQGVLWRRCAALR